MKHFPSKHVDPVEVIVGDSRTADDGAALRLQEERTPMWINVFALLIWLIAGAVPFVPFAFDTSPWDAVRLRVQATRVIGGICSRVRHSSWHFQRSGSGCVRSLPRSFQPQ
jgi:hypothetical protein